MRCFFILLRGGTLLRRPLLLLQPYCSFPRLYCLLFLFELNDSSFCIPFFPCVGRSSLVFDLSTSFFRFSPFPERTESSVFLSPFTRSPLSWWFFRSGPPSPMSLLCPFPGLALLSFLPEAPPPPLVFV